MCRGYYLYGPSGTYMKVFQDCIIDDRSRDQKISLQKVGGKEYPFSFHLEQKPGKIPMSFLTVQPYNFGGCLPVWMYQKINMEFQPYVYSLTFGIDLTYVFDRPSTLPSGFHTISAKDWYYILQDRSYQILFENFLFYKMEVQQSQETPQDSNSINLSVILIGIPTSSDVSVTLRSSPLTIMTSNRIPVSRNAKGDYSNGFYEHPYVIFNRLEPFDPLLSLCGPADQKRLTLVSSIPNSASSPPTLRWIPMEDNPNTVT